jgi:hypothetical protein
MRKQGPVRNQGSTRNRRRRNPRMPLPSHLPVQPAWLRNFQQEWQHLTPSEQKQITQEVRAELRRMKDRGE